MRIMHSIIRIVLQTLDHSIPNFSGSFPYNILFVSCFHTISEFEIQQHNFSTQESVISSKTDIAEIKCAYTFSVLPD